MSCRFVTKMSWLCSPPTVVSHTTSAVTSTKMSMVTEHWAKSLSNKWSHGYKARLVGRAFFTPHHFLSLHTATPRRRPAPCLPPDCHADCAPSAQTLHQKSVSGQAVTMLVCAPVPAFAPGQALHGECDADARTTL